MMFTKQLRQAARRSVGTRGGRREGWGPCACPRWRSSVGFPAFRTQRVATRTGTRPCLHSTTPPVPTGRGPLPLPVLVVNIHQGAAKATARDSELTLTPAQGLWSQDQTLDLLGLLGLLGENNF